MRADDGHPAGHMVRRLTLFDSIMLVVTGTIGPSIFIVPADVFRAVPNPGIAMLLWIAAGGITLLAGLACAELGAMFPEAGGQYVFMREAYGKFTAFLYGWVLFTAGNSAALASMGIAVALFLGQAVPSLDAERVMYAKTIFGLHLTIKLGGVIAVGSVIILTAINLRSIKVAAWIQNSTALVYLVAVLVIVAVGFLWGHGSLVAFHLAAASRPRLDHRGWNRRRHDSALLQLRRLGIFVLGRRRDQRPAAKFAARVDLRNFPGDRHLSVGECRISVCVGPDATRAHHHARSGGDGDPVFGGRRPLVGFLHRAHIFRVGLRGGARWGAHILFDGEGRRFFAA